VRKVSIIPRGMAGGYTKSLQEDKKYLTLSYLKDELAMFLGGRSAEELIFNEISTGASSDIKQATDFARRMVVSWGMSEELGPRTFGQKEELVFLGREISEQRDYGETVADLIDKEVNRIIQDAHEQALKVLTENRAKLEQLAQALLVHETLEGDELDKVFKEPPEEKPPVESTPAAVSKAEAKIKERITRKVAPPLPGSPIPKPRQAPQPS
jgi:cell division protease FtsH